MVQLTGFPSISAAAEGPVTLGVSSIGGERAFVWVGLKCGSEERRAGEGTRPYEEEGSFRNIGRGRSQTGLRAHTVRHYGGKRTGSVGSAWPGAAVEWHQGQILQTQGPVARRELRVPLRFCAPEILLGLAGMRPP